MPTKGPNGETIYTTEEKRALIEQLTVLAKSGHEHLAYDDPKFKDIMGQMADAGMLTECPTGIAVDKKDLKKGIGITNIIIHAEKNDDPCILVGVDKNQDRYNSADGIDVSGTNKADVTHFGLLTSVKLENFVRYMRSEPPKEPNGFWMALDSVLRFLGGNGLERCREYERKQREHETKLRKISKMAGYKVEEPQDAVQDEPEQVKEVAAPEANVVPEVNVAPEVSASKIAEHKALYDNMLKRFSGDLSTIMEDVSELDEEDELEYISKMMACIKCKELLNADPPQFKNAKDVEALGKEYLENGEYADAVALMRKEGGVNANLLKVLASENPDDIFEVLAGKASNFRKAVDHISKNAKKKPAKKTEEKAETKASETKATEAKATETKASETKATETKETETKADEAAQSEKKTEAKKPDPQKILNEVLMKARMVNMKRDLIQKSNATQEEALREAQRLQGMNHNKISKREEERVNARARERAAENMMPHTDFDTYFDVLDMKEKMAPLISEELVKRMAKGEYTPLFKEYGDVKGIEGKEREALQNELTDKLLGNVKSDPPLSKMMNMLASSNHLVDTLKMENPITALTDRLFEYTDLARKEAAEEARKEAEQKEKAVREAESKRNYHYIEEDRADILTTLKQCQALQKNDLTLAEKKQMETDQSDLRRLTANAISKEFFMNRVATGQVPVPDGFSAYDLKTEDGLNDACKHFEKMMCGEDKIASQALENMVSSKNVQQLVSSGDMLTDAYFENLQKVNTAQQEMANDTTVAPVNEAEKEIAMDTP